MSEEELVRMNILEEASSLIYGAKEKEHGDPLVVYEMVAAFWRTYLKGKQAKAVQSGLTVADLGAEDVFQMLSLMKKARSVFTTKHDDVLDDAGYVGLVDRARRAGL